MNIYNLIEANARFELHELRTSNEVARMDLFRRSFLAKIPNDEVHKARTEYIKQLQDHIQTEIEKYKNVQDDMLKIVKINEQVWNSSMDAYLPSGEQYIRKALK